MVKIERKEGDKGQCSEGERKKKDMGRERNETKVCEILKKGEKRRER